MEHWQREHIQRKLPELIQQTICNPLLLARLQAKHVLHASDVEDLKIIGNKHDQSMKLYSILQTRLKSFDILKEALQETCQNGAFTILNQLNHEFRNYGQISFDKSQLLGRGCFGTKVYRGKFDERIVAVKVLICEDEERASALKEIDSLLSLDGHPNIVRYIKREVNDELVLIALELCTTNLYDFVTKSYAMPNGQELSEEGIVDILKQATEGVEFLHASRVVHRDLKPTNILILSFEAQISKLVVKISDFGMSRRITEGHSRFSVHTSGFGTEGWMAPEVVRHLDGDPEADSDSMTYSMDIFSLGCIFYFVLAEGFHPFGKSLTQRQYNILAGSPTYLHNGKITKVPSKSLGFVRLINAMLAFIPAARPTATQVLSHSVFQPTMTDMIKRGLALRHNGNGDNDDNQLEDREVEKLTMYSTPFPTGILEDEREVFELEYKNQSFPLHHAVAKGDLYAITILLQEKRADVNCLQNGNTPIQYMMSNQPQQNFLETAQLLVENGANVKILDRSSGANCLHDLMKGKKTSGSGWLSVFKFLVQKGVSPTHLASQGRTIFHNCDLEGVTPEEFHELVECLIESNSGAPLNQETEPPVLHSALKHFDLLEKTVELLREIDYDFNRNFDGKDGFYLAIEKNRGLACIKSLIGAGLQVELRRTQTNDGVWTPLMQACKNGNLELITFLTLIGANVNDCPTTDGSLLHLLLQFADNFRSSEEIHEAVVRLVEAGADLTISNAQQKMVVEVAKEKCSHCLLTLKTVELLQKPQTCQRNNEARLKEIELVAHALQLPVFYAAAAGDTFALSYLLEIVGSVESERDENGDNPLQFVLKNPPVSSFLEVVQILVENGANVKVYDSNRNNCIALMLSQRPKRQGWVDVFKFLMKEGVDPNQWNKNNVPCFRNASFDSATPEDLHQLLSFILDVNKNKKNRKIELTGWFLHAALEHVEPSLETLQLLQQTNYRFDIQSHKVYDGKTPFCIAVEKRRSVSCLKNLIQLGADPQLVGTKLGCENVWRPLMVGCINGNLEAIRFLVGLGADVNDKPPEHEVPLHLVIQNSDNFLSKNDVLEAVQILVDAGASLTATNKDKRTPLMEAMKQNKLGKINSDVVQYLHSESSKPCVPSEEPEFYAIMPPPEKVPPEIRELIYLSWSKSYGPDAVIHKCAEAGDVWSLQILLLRKNNGVNAKHRSETPLFYLMRDQPKENFDVIVQLLIENGADLSFVNGFEKNCLETLLTEEKKTADWVKVFKILVQSGVNWENKKGRTFSRYAFRNADPDQFHEVVDVCAQNLATLKKVFEEEILNAALQYFDPLEETLETLARVGYDFNKCTKQNVGSLNVAIENHRSMSVILKMISLGAHVDLKTPYGPFQYNHDRSLNTPLRVACNCVYVEMIKYLVAEGADVNEIASDGKSPIIAVITSDNHLLDKRKEIMEAVQLLVEAGADLAIKDKFGNTALGLAKNRCHFGNVGQNTVDYIQEKLQQLEKH